MKVADEQLDLPLRSWRSHGLLSEHFLLGDFLDWPSPEGLDISALRDELVGLWKREQAGLATANEAQTEERFIQPVLRLLGFEYTVQTGLLLAHGRRQPDYALFTSDEARRQADAVAPELRFENAEAVADAKRFDRPLDGRQAGGAAREDPTAQIINYVSLTKCPFGVLTNGRLWRLYASERGLLAGACFEVDLVALLERDDQRAFQYFATFFSAAGHRRGDGDRSFVQRALDESVAAAVQVGSELERQVFAAVPALASGLMGEEEPTRAALDVAFDHALVLLFRLLFCLYAEARGLLPIENPHYREYSLRDQKEELAADLDRGRVFSRLSDDLYNDLRALFRIVDRGDESLGVSEYNGGLFSPARHPTLRVDRCRMPSSRRPSTPSTGRVASSSTIALFRLDTWARSTSGSSTTGSSSRATSHGW